MLIKIENVEIGKISIYDKVAYLTVIQSYNFEKNGEQIKGKNYMSNITLFTNNHQEDIIFFNENIGRRISYIKIKNKESYNAVTKKLENESRHFRERGELLIFTTKSEMDNKNADTRKKPSLGFFDNPKTADEIDDSILDDAILWD